MFVDTTLAQNPRLIEAAAELHRAGQIPSNCYVIDLDTVATNARAISTASEAAGLQCFQMTKQFGRNPLVAETVAANGIDKVVAVDYEEARVLHAFGLAIGHIGHLVQVPRDEVRGAVAMTPDLVTVFGVPQAERIAAVARQSGTEQAVLIRVVGDDDTFYPAQAGGVTVDSLVETASEIARFNGVRVAGVTSFPCMLFNEETRRLEPTRNLTTLRESAEALRKAGFGELVVNAPSASCCATVETLAQAGATMIEPGSCLTGHTPLHAVSEQPEKPAMIYVTEVTHQLEGTSYALAGGLYPRSRARQALVFGSGDAPLRAEVRLDPPDAIDYYGALATGSEAVAPGDTVVYAFRSQVFVSRSFVAVLGGVSSAPEILGVWTSTGFPLDARLLPVGVPDAEATIS